MVQYAKPTSGEKFTPSASLTRDTIDAVYDYKRRQLGGPIDPVPGYLPTDLVTIKNASGAARRRGEILEVTGIGESTLHRDTRFLTGGSPSPAIDKHYAVLWNEQPSNGFDTAQMSGVVFALVNISDSAHKTCTIASATYVLASAVNGPIPIVYQPSGTGEKECLINLPPRILYKPRIRFTLSAALATSDASKTGTIQTQWGPGLDNPNTSSGAITLNNLAMASGYLYEAASGAPGAATWQDGNNYLIDALPCP